jgi:predicted restriction endonuclease
MPADSAPPVCTPSSKAAKLNGVNPMAYLTDVLERIVSGRTKQNELHTLLPWNWAATAFAETINQAA